MKHNRICVADLFVQLSFGSSDEGDGETVHTHPSKKWKHVEVYRLKTDGGMIEMSGLCPPFSCVAGSIEHDNHVHNYHSQIRGNPVNTPSPGYVRIHVYVLSMLKNTIHTETEFK